MTYGRPQHEDKPLCFPRPRDVRVGGERRLGFRAAPHPRKLRPVESSQPALGLRVHFYGREKEKLPVCVCPDSVELVSCGAFHSYRA